MRFRICKETEYVLYRKDVICLQQREGHGGVYGAPFDAVYFDDCGREFSLGAVRIGMYGMHPANILDYLSEEFISLPETFFSLGQSEDYYENVKKLGDANRELMLAQLRDLLNTSRKYAQAIIEYFDKVHITKKADDIHYLDQGF